MASEVPSVQTPAISLVQGSQAPTELLVQRSGNTLPQDGKVAATPQAFNPSIGQPVAPQPRPEAALPHPNARQQQQAQEQAARQADIASQLATVNKYLNDSGRAAQFRASANAKTIEEVNPATGEVIATYSAEMFEALARSVGIGGAPAIDEHA